MKAETQSFYEAAVVRAVARITTSLDEPLDLKALAKEAALSSFHFHRVFRGLLGETPVEMHRRLRLERAAEQLASGNERVIHIAFAAGYETHEAFTRAFRSAYGVSPSVLRDRTRSIPPGERRLPTLLAARSAVHFGDSPGRARPLVLSPGESTMNVTLESLPEQRVVCVSHRGPYNRIFEAFRQLEVTLRGTAIPRAGASLLAIFHDDPEITPPEELLRSDACLTVPEAVKLPTGLFEDRLAAGRYAKATHLGPYEKLGDTWSELMGGWLPRSGERVGVVPSFEVYQNTPADVPPTKLETDLYLPLA